MRRLLLRSHLSGVDAAGPRELWIVCVYDLFVVPRLRNADRVLAVCLDSRVQSDYEKLLAARAEVTLPGFLLGVSCFSRIISHTLTHERVDHLLIVVSVDPLKTVEVCIVVPESRMFLINVIDGFDVLLILRMIVIAEHEPFKFLILTPLDELRELVTHEVQLLPRMSHLEQVEKPDSGELTPGVARHTPYERELAVDDLIMRKRQNIVLAVRVCNSKRQLVVAARPEREVGLHIFERIVHPAHVPLVMESEPTGIWRCGNEGPRRAFLCDRNYTRTSCPDHIVEFLQEFDRVQISLVSILVELLQLLIIDAEIQIEHARDAVDSDTVSMVLVDPVHCIRQEEAPYLRPAIVKLICAPVRMLFFLIQLTAVEFAKPLFIRTEVSRHPVKDNADSLSVAAVHQVLEVCRRSIS